MKLTPTSVDQVEALVQVAMVAGLKKLIIADGKIRGIDDKQLVVLLTDANVPDLGGKRIGINRIDQLAARISLVKNAGGLDIEATPSTNEPLDIMLMDLSFGKTKAQFRCAATEVVKGVPKSVADTYVWEIKVPGSLLPMIVQGVSAMGSDSITIASKDGTSVSFEATDSNKDVFSIDSDQAPVWIGAADKKGTAFAVSFIAKTLTSLLKEAVKDQPTGVTIKLGENNTLALKVRGFDFVILPE